MSAWNASGVRVSSRPSRKSRSIVAARCLASAEAPFAGCSECFAAGSATIFLAVGAARPAGLRLRGTVAAAALRGDIEVVSLLKNFVLAQFHPAIGYAFAGLHVVFHAVPGADEMHLGVGEIKAARSLVGHDPLFDLGNGQSLAGRTALVEAEIAVRVVFAFFLEDADLVLAHEHDPAVAVVHFRCLRNELLSHSGQPSTSFGRCRSGAVGPAPALPQYARTAPEAQPTGSFGGMAAI